MYLTSLILSLSFFATVALAQVMPANPDVGQILTELFTNPSGLGSLGIAMSVVVLAVQLLKWNILDKFFIGKTKSIIKLALIFLLGQAYTYFFLVKSGVPNAQAIIGIITGGGAIALYNIIKPLWNK